MSVDAAPPGSPALFAGRFEVERHIKHAQGVDTFVGKDRDSGLRVIIKASEVNAASAARLRLEHEAELLGRLQSPAIAPLLDTGAEGGRTFVVRPFVEGETLGQRLETGALGMQEALSVGRDLMIALRDAHVSGALHRDVKPANIIVFDEEGASLRASLIDFGLARSAQLDVSLRDVPVGTARYMAPEQAGMLNLPVEEPSDLYAAGTVLFECLAGTPPFDGQSVGELLRQHLASPPPELRSLGLAVPRALDEIVQRLLRKDPRERYQSAEAVLVDLKALGQALSRGERDPALVVGLEDKRGSLAEPSFVGRRRELETLGRQLGRAFDGQGALMALEGLSGGGKSRLLDEIAQQSVQRGAWVLRGQGLDQAAQRPLQILGGVVRGLLDDPDLAEVVGARLGDERLSIGEALPELRPLISVADHDAFGREEHGETRSLQAISALLSALGSPERPAVVLLDDCQWADEQSLKVLEAWRRRWVSGEVHVMIVAAFRIEEVGEVHLLRGLDWTGHLKLAPFGGEVLARLATSMAGPLPEAVVEAVTRLSEGNPFMAIALLRGFVETGGLKHDQEGWHIDPEAISEVQSSRRAAVILTRRLELLDDDTVALLSICALLGREFEVAEAIDLARHDAAQAIPALEEARRRHIVWLDESMTRGRFLHDKLREVLLSMLGSAARESLHKRIAERLESHNLDRVFDLAFHFDAAGEGDRALDYALEAGRQARSRHALEIAERYYRIAARVGRNADKSKRQHIQEGLGDVLMLRGRYDEASELLEEARLLARGAYAQAVVDAKLGELAFKRGDMTGASRAIERGLRRLGRFVPRRRATFFIIVVWEAMVQVLHTLMPKAFVGRKPLEGAEAELLTVRLFSRLAYPYWFKLGILPALWTLLREVNLAERFVPCLERGQAYANHGIAMIVIPHYARAIRYAQRGLEMRRSLGDPWGEGQSLHFYGIVLYHASRFDECQRACNEAVRLLTRTGDRWERNTAMYHKGLALYRKGEMREALEVARALHREGSDGGDPQALGEAVEIWSKATGGRVPEVLVAPEMERHLEDLQTRCLVFQAEALRHLGAGRYEEAVSLLEEAEQLGRKLRSDYVAPIPAWLTTALRRQAEEAPSWDPARRRALIKRAEKACARAATKASRYRSNMPHVLRERALLQALTGKGPRARKTLTQAISEARDQGARHEEALARLAQGQLGAVLGWPDAEGDTEAARQALSALEIPEAPAGRRRDKEITLSLVERFDRILSEGRRIASALDKAAVFTAAHEAATALLRPERCAILVIGRAGEAPEVAVGGGSVSRTTVSRALEEGRVVLTSEDLPDSSSESVVLSQVRSALCAPIMVREQVVAVIYATNRQLSGAFDQDEARLGEYIATLAGAALENAENFAEVQALTDSLEKRSEELERRGTELEESLLALQRAQAQLIHSGKLAAVGTLMAGLSHELNNPLAIIVGFSQTLLSQVEEGDPRQMALRSIEREAQRCARLVRTLLSFSRRGQDNPQREQVFVGELFDQVRHLLEGQAKRRQVALHIEPPRLGRPMTLNATEVESALVNLVKNGLDATDPGGRVSLTGELATHNGVEGVRVLIQDTGCGMPPEVIERIFEPFFTTKPVGQGTGLGLSLAHSIVEAHGGVLSVASEAGEGTTIRCWLPLDPP